MTSLFEKSSNADDEEADDEEDEADDEEDEADDDVAEGDKADDNVAEEEVDVCSLCLAACSSLSNRFLSFCCSVVASTRSLGSNKVATRFPTHSSCFYIATYKKKDHSSQLTRIIFSYVNYCYYCTSS